MTRHTCDSSGSSWTDRSTETQAPVEERGPAGPWLRAQEAACTAGWSAWHDGSECYREQCGEREGHVADAGNGLHVGTFRAGGVLSCTCVVLLQIHRHPA